jgi:hypothetical protein
MASTACLACLVSTVRGHSKKRRKKAKNAVLVVGTPQNLSKLFLYISMVLVVSEKAFLFTFAVMPSLGAMFHFSIALLRRVC